MSDHKSVRKRKSKSKRQLLLFLSLCSIDLQLVASASWIKSVARLC